MSNLLAGGLAVLLAVTYLVYYAYRIQSVVLWIIILVNLCFLLYDYYQGITQGEDHI